MIVGRLNDDAVVGNILTVVEAVVPFSQAPKILPILTKTLIFKKATFKFNIILNSFVFVVFKKDGYMPKYNTV